MSVVKQIGLEVEAIYALANQLTPILDGHDIPLAEAACLLTYLFVCPAVQNKENERMLLTLSLLSKKITEVIGYVNTLTDEQVQMVLLPHSGQPS